MQEHRSQIKEDNPGISIGEIAKKAGEMWRTMDDKSVSKKNRPFIYISIGVFWLFRACLCVCVCPEQNTLREPSQGRAIPRWNRLGKII